MPKLNEMKAKPGKPVQAGKVRSIRIEFKSNGFEVTVDRMPEPGKKGMDLCCYDNPKDSMVFTQPGECLAHVGGLMGSGEGHEKAEPPAKEAKEEAAAKDAKK